VHFLNLAAAYIRGNPHSISGGSAGHSRLCDITSSIIREKRGSMSPDVAVLVIEIIGALLAAPGGTGAFFSNASQVSVQRRGEHAQNGGH
jgi:hypothetical protein